MEEMKKSSVYSESLERKIQSLSEEKKRFLKQMMAASNTGKKSAVQKNRIERRRAEEKMLPCSQLQTEFWYRWKMFPDSFIDNIAGYVRVKGKLSKWAIEKAFKTLLQRHEVLRSRFVYSDEGVYVELDNENRGDIKFVDYTLGTSEEACKFKEMIIELMQKEASECFDLSKGRLIRLRCYKTSQDEWYLLMVLHHSISDGTSTNVLIKEMLNSIESLSGNKAALNPELSIQFYDYVKWQNDKLSRGEYESQKEYWKEELKDCDMNLNLSESPFKKEDALFEGGRICFHIDKEIRDRVEAISRKYVVTPFAFYMTVFRTLLLCYTKQEDAVIVIPVQGRNHEQVQALVGCFLNMVSIKNQLNAEDNFIDCVKRENSKVLKGLQNQEIPFGTVIKELDIHSESMASSVYHIVFSYEGNALKNVATSQFEVEFEELFLNTTKSDLILELNQDTNGLTGWFEFNSGKFSTAQITLFKDAFLEMLKNLIENENQLISHIDFITDSERKLVLEYGTGNRRDWKIKTINKMFSEFAARQPEKEALIDINRTVTYGELEKITNQAARYLRNIGVGNETVVALMMGKSMEFFVTVMAVIKAGGAYVPIEPSYPKERIRYLMEDSGAGYLIYDEEYKGDLSFLPKVTAIKYPEIDLEPISHEPLPEYNDVNTLAYVIYTSGTTGNPKGVMVEHRGVSNLAYFFNDTYGLGLGDRVLQFSHIVFDACVWEMAISLLTGAALCIVKKETLLDIPEFVNQIHKLGVTVSYFSPQYWKQICKEDLKFRILLTAGSEADETVVKTAAKSELYVNGYGPTENTVCVSLWNRRHGEKLPKKIPIGKPMSNAQVYIMEKGKLCGAYVTGEICVAGTAVARGYLNRPELTDERFTDNPFGPGKLYHTGDYGRWQENGEIDYAGRIDGQVKIRGYRVETGEIENCLCRHRNVDNAAVAVTEDSKGEKILAAYLVLNSKVNVKQLEEYLNNILPFYMIPAKYYRIESIPLNINDKTDYKALEKLGEPIESGYEYIRPATETERKLAAIWEELLKVENISVNDSFFECGGDSIIILQIIERAAREGIHIELKSFYEDKTIANIAKNAVVTALNEKELENGSMPYDISPMQKMVLDLGTENSDSYCLGTSLKLEGEYSLQDINSAVEYLLKKHSILNSCCDGTKSENKAFMLAPDDYELTEEAEIEENADKKQLLEIYAAAKQHIDLKAGRTIKAVLLKEKALNYRLLLVVHKFVCDERSLELIAQDIKRSLTRKDLTHSEKIKDLTYAALSNALKRYSKSQQSEYNREKWLNMDLQDVSSHPVDRERTADMTHEQKEMDVELPLSLREAFMKEEFGSFHISCYELLLSAFIRTLYKWKKDGGLLFLENQGRDLQLEDIEVLAAVGCFSSVYPFIYSSTLCENQPGEFLKLVKNKLFEVNQIKQDYNLLRSEESLPMILKRPEVIMSYRTDSEDSSFESLQSKHCCLIELKVNNEKGRLTISLDYNADLYREDTILSLSEAFISEIEAIVDYCRGTTDTGITASDFENDDIAQEDLEYVLSKYL
jgi:amino acid adenylation domain-containing protein